MLYLHIVGRSCWRHGGRVWQDRQVAIKIWKAKAWMQMTIIIFKENSLWHVPIMNYNSFFLSWHAAKSFIKNLTLESFIPTSMLSINKKTIWLGVTSNASEVPNIRVDTDSWRHLPRHLVRFSHAFPLDSFSRAAWTRSHVRCWQLSSLGKNLEFRYLQVMLIDNIRFTIPTP